MNFFWWQKNRLRTVWRIEKDGRSSHLVGTAHFCPYSFEKPLTKLIDQAEMVLFEGPLDAESMARVAEYGRCGDGSVSIYETLSPEAIEELNEHLTAILDGDATKCPHLDFLQVPKTDYVKIMTSGVRPWMAFFSIWSTLLNWKHSMDRGAYGIALSRGKRIGFLETIDDQLQALDGIPFDRIVAFFNDFQHWKYYRRQYLNIFLAGDMERFASMLAVFPTRCDSILTRRDPIFFMGIEEQIARQPTVAFVGNAHILGLHKLFSAAGYRITQETV